MAHSRSTKKRVRTNAKAAGQNRALKSKIRSIRKDFASNVAAGNKEAAKQQFEKLVAIVQSVAVKGAIHKNRAANIVSKAARLMNKQATA